MSKLFTASCPFKNCYFLKFKTQYELASTFMRLQEFYESPFDDIKGKYFTHIQFMDRYAKEYGDFTYTSDWGGFNVPGKIVNNWSEIFYKNFSKNEQILSDFILNKIKTEHNYYLIATTPGNEHAMSHEIAHALYYLNSKYNNEIMRLVHKYPDVELLKKVLMDMGYCKSVLWDEIQAYIITSSDKEFLTIFGVRRHSCANYISQTAFKYFPKLTNV